MNNGKSLGTDRCDWWYSIETWSIGILSKKGDVKSNSHFSKISKL